MQMSIASNAAPTLAASQSATVEKIKGARNMEPKDYPAEMGFDSFSIGDGQGTLTAFEAPGKVCLAPMHSGHLLQSSSLHYFINGDLLHDHSTGLTVQTCVVASTTWLGAVPSTLPARQRA